MVASSNPGRTGGRFFFFFSPELTLCADLFGVRSTPVLPQWNIEDPGLSAKSSDGRLQINTHPPLTQRSRSGLIMPLSRHSVGNLSGNELTRNLSGNIQPQSSQFAEPPWSDPGIKSGISVCDLIPTKKKEEKKEEGADGE